MICFVLKLAAGWRVDGRNKNGSREIQAINCGLGNR